MAITTVLDRSAIAGCYLPGGEAARNNDNGTVAADIIAPATVKIRDVTITGTGSSGTAPSKPTFTFRSDGTGLTVDGDAGATHLARYRRDGQATDFSALGSVVGDGDVLWPSLAEGSYLFQVVPQLGTVYGLPSAAKRKYVGGDSRSVEERIWLDLANALDGEAALASGKLFYIDRQENRLREILRGNVSYQRGALGYISAEWGGYQEVPGPDEYEEDEGTLYLHVLIHEDQFKRGGWDLSRICETIVQAAEADRTRGDLCWLWRYRGPEPSRDVLRPWRLAVLRFGYKFTSAPAARVSV